MWLPLALWIALAAGCAVPGQGPVPAPTPRPGGSPAQPRVRLGTLQVLAGTVTLNGAVAANGAPVYSGDKIATGAASGAQVDLPGFGWVRLDAETDPVLERVVQGICRVLVRVLQAPGLVFGSGTALCLEDVNGVAVALNSSVNLQVLPGRSIATVVDGTVTLMRPVSRVLTRGQQVEVLRGGALRGPVTLSDAQLRTVYAWVAKHQQIK